MGLLASIGLILVMENPGILSIPLGSSHEPTSQHKFNDFLVRSNTGLGAEKATAH